MVQDHEPAGILGSTPDAAHGGSGESFGSAEATIALRRTADGAYLNGKICEAIELYALLLEGGQGDLTALSALAEIARLMGRLTASDPFFSAARTGVRRRLAQLLGGSSPRRWTVITPGSNRPGPSGSSSR
jgi:hypothetical protein